MPLEASCIYRGCPCVCVLELPTLLGFLFKLLPLVAYHKLLQDLGPCFPLRRACSQRSCREWVGTLYPHKRKVACTALRHPHLPAATAEQARIWQ